MYIPLRKEHTWIHTVSFGTAASLHTALHPQPISLPAQPAYRPLLQIPPRHMQTQHTAAAIIVTVPYGNALATSSSMRFAMLGFGGGGAGFAEAFSTRLKNSMTFSILELFTSF